MFCGDSMEIKLKYFGFALLIMIVGMIFIGAISAEDARVGGQLVTVPDDYDVVFENSTYLLMRSGTDHIIIMTYPPMDKDAGQYMDQFIKSGMNLTGESNYTHGPLNVNQQNYTYKTQNVDFYYIQYDEDLYVIDFFYPLNESRDESFNPVNTILDSFV